MKAEVVQQRLILELAGIDADLSRLEHRATHLAEQQRLEAVQAEHRTANDGLAALGIALDDLEGQVAKFEAEIDSVRKREDRDRSLLDGGTVDVKHIAELQHELETLERRQSSLEDSLLEIMERREVLQTQQAAALARIDDLQVELVSAGEARDQAMALIDQSRRQAASRRDEVIASLDGELAALYERQRVRSGIGAGGSAGAAVRCLPHRNRSRRGRADHRCTRGRAHEMP